MKSLLLLPLSLACAVLAGCHDADAGSNLEARLAQAEAQIAALQAQQHRVLTASGGSFHAKALDADADATAIGTLLSFDGSPSVATTANVRSALGFLFAVSLEDGEVQGPGGNVGGIVRFATADCSGQAFVGAGDISAYAARQGAVFRILQADGSAAYYAVLAGTEVLEPATYGSFYAWGVGCTAQDAVLPAYPTEVNDPAVTGVGSVPVAAAVTIG